MALRKEPERRYTSADQFAEDVRRFRRGWPVTAQPETWTLSTCARSSGAIACRRRPPRPPRCRWSATAVALRQARLANEQRARAEQVTAFVTGFLGATPSGPDWALQNKGVSLRVVELADASAARIGGELARQPEAEATLRSVLAHDVLPDGRDREVARHAQRAIELYDRLYRHDDPRRVLGRARAGQRRERARPVRRGGGAGAGESRRVARPAAGRPGGDGARSSAWRSCGWASSIWRSRRSRRASRERRSRARSRSSERGLCWRRISRSCSSNAASSSEAAS